MRCFWLFQDSFTAEARRTQSGAKLDKEPSLRLGGEEKRLIEVMP